MIFTEGKEKTGLSFFIPRRFRTFVGDKGTYGLHSARRGRKSGLALKMAVAFNGDSSPTAVFSALFSKIVSNRIYMETEMTRQRLMG